MTIAALVLAAAMALQAQDAGPARAEAERLARSGAHARALEQFERLAATNPDDVEARIWIGRLHAWMGHTQKARAVFESVLITDPRAVEALVGAGAAAMNTGDLHAAERLLAEAEKIAPESADVLAAQGRLRRRTGHLRLALAYFDRAILLSPNDPDIRDGRDAIRAQRAHRIEAGYQFEHFSTDLPESHLGALELNVRASDRVRALGRVQQQRKFSLLETRGGAGIEWLAAPAIQVRASGMFGDQTIIFPRADALLEVDVTPNGVTWLGSVRHIRFTLTRAWIGSLGGSWTWRDRTTATARYYYSQTEFDISGADAGNHAMTVQIAHHATKPLWLHAGYAHGYESFETVTADRLQQRGADTVNAGFNWRITAMSSFFAGVELQRRDDSSRLTTASLGIVQRF